MPIQFQYCQFFQLRSVVGEDLDDMVVHGCVSSTMSSWLVFFQSSLPLVNSYETPAFDESYQLKQIKKVDVERRKKISCLSLCSPYLSPKSI